MILSSIQLYRPLSNNENINDKVSSKLQQYLYCFEKLMKTDPI